MQYTLPSRPWGDAECASVGQPPDRRKKKNLIRAPSAHRRASEVPVLRLTLGLNADGWGAVPGKTFKCVSCVTVAVFESVAHQLLAVLLYSPGRDPMLENRLFDELTSLSQSRFHQVCLCAEAGTSSSYGAPTNGECTISALSECTMSASSAILQYVSLSTSKAIRLAWALGACKARAWRNACSYCRTNTLSCQQPLLQGWIGFVLSVCSFLVTQPDPAVTIETKL